MRYKLIIFDLDGTLVDAYKAVSASLNFALNKAGLPPLSDETIKRSVGWGDRNLLSRFVSADKVDAIFKIYRHHHKRALKTGTKFLPYARQILLSLKKKEIKLAVASNRPTVYTRIILKHLKVISLFDCILCADKVRLGKPAPDILKRILKKLNVAAHEALYAGDMTIDVEAGRRARVRTVAVLTGSCKRAEISPLCPYKIIKNLKWLIPIVG